MHETIETIRTRALIQCCILLLIMTSLPLGANAAPAQSPPTRPVLSEETFAPLIRALNATDRAAKSDGADSHNDSLSWLTRNVPRFECPDAALTQTYWFRWWVYQKHLRKTAAGWIVTEFLPDVPWAGRDNSISCAAGHHLYEGRWLRDPQYMADYSRFWFHDGEPRRYSFWAADSVHAVALATGDNALEQRLLPDLIANYRAWSASNQDATGLFHQIDDRDGMEYSLGGSGYRPTINSYMYGDAVAIAEIAHSAGQAQVATEFRAQAARLKTLVQQHLWDPQAQFFDTAPAVTAGNPIRTAGVREQVGFIPWYFHLPDPGYESAWKQLLDPNGFAAPYGPTTAERRAPGFMRPEAHDCLWNGPSWPYATTQTLVAMANLLNDYSQSVVTRADYLALLQGYARSQQKAGKPWIAEDLDADTGKWIVDLPRSVYYNHSAFADLVITGLAGLRPRADGKLVINPLVPDKTWDWFCLDGVPYHGRSLTIIWDRTGHRYGRGQGLSLFEDGKMLAHRTDLGSLTATLTPTSTSVTPASAAAPPTAASAPWVKYAGNPVLGGALGTCFDVCLLRDGSRYRMYFSWRPKASLALVESADGIHWSTPQIVLGPTATGWEDDINRPSVIKQGDGYHLWYTGQAKGRSAIGYATSPDGIHWSRQAQPVLVPQTPWEKVAVMCPDVLWDEAAHQYRMWYSGGEQYEPDAIGYATSPDGIHWSRLSAPIFAADPANPWEQHKVTACQVAQRDGWYYMFYVGFRDIDHAAIGVSRSRDGVTGWQRCPLNPIVSPTPDGWDADACYKPYALYDGHRWLLWYNGRHGGTEQIGLATRAGEDLGF